MAITARCPAGTIATVGGGAADFEGDALAYSGPDFNDSGTLIPNWSLAMDDSGSGATAWVACYNPRGPVAAPEQSADGRKAVAARHRPAWRPTAPGRVGRGQPSGRQATPDVRVAWPTAHLVGQRPDEVDRDGRGPPPLAPLTCVAGRRARSVHAETASPTCTDEPPRAARRAARGSGRPIVVQPWSAPVVVFRGVRGVRAAGSSHRPSSRRSTGRGLRGRSPAGVPSAACANRVIDERSFCASTGPRTCTGSDVGSAVNACAHSTSRGPSTGCATYARASSRPEMAYRCAVWLRPSPATWGKTNHIQWVRFRPSRSSLRAAA